MLLLLVVPTISLLTAPRCQPPTVNAADVPRDISRRAAIGGLFLTPAAAFAAVDMSYLTAECDNSDNVCIEKQQAAIKEKMKIRAKKSAAKRIEESKKGPTRKPTDLVENRKKNVDYSCVAATGSPCPASDEPEPN